MKTKGYIALFLIMAVTGLQGITFAQEGGFIMPDSEESNAVETTRGENVRSGYSIDPATKKANRSTTRENTESKKRSEEEAPSVKTQEVKSAEKKQPTSTPKKTEESDDSVLSFNILYYMIQKFKFSDVIDQ